MKSRASISTRSRPSRRIAVVLSAFVAACSGSRAKTDSSQPTVNAKVSADSLAAAIDRNAAQLRQDTATVFGLSAEGAGLTASYAGDTLRRLRAEILGEMGRTTETFYFDSALVLVVKSKVRYDAPLSGRVTDSSATRFDLTATSISASVADSLRAEVRDLLARMRKR